MLDYEVKILDIKMKANKQAIVVLHEIYGVNEFIQRQCQQLREAGYDVFCPNMIGRTPFPYEESAEAYDFFRKNIGFEVYQKISTLITQLKEDYDDVFAIGYSIGATIAWRCCENTSCSGIIACYGSRVRDYTELNPVCPTLLVFAKEDSFDVEALVHRLQSKPRLSIIQYEAEHGFLDCFSRHYNSQQSIYAEESIACFLKECTK